MAELNIADVIANHRRGSHVVILQIPFEFEGKKIEAIEVGPFNLDHRMRWREGEYKSPYDLMCAVCHDPITHKVMDPLALRQMCNPDDERLEFTFMSMLPNEMRDGVINKQWPGSLVAAPAAENIARSVTRPRRERDVEDDEIDPNSYEDQPMQEDRGLNIG